MENDISIDADKNQISLKNNIADKVTLTLKAVFGTVPVIGGALSEIIGSVIPNQRIERLQLFAEVLSEKIKYMEDDIKLKMTSEEFTDLLEDALYQASRSLTNERRDYIASILKNSLTNDDLSHLQQKKLLSLLGEINDAEVIFLKYEYIQSNSAKREFYQKHESVLKPVKASFGSDKSIQDQAAFRKIYRDKLLEVGLLEPVFVKPKKGEMPVFDERTGQIKAESYRVPHLGRLLLQFIDQYE